VLNVVFRVDASQLIGIGHIMRCLTLADRFKKNSAHTRFVCRHLPDSLYALIIQKGHEVVITNNSPVLHVELDELAHAGFLATSQQKDAADTINAISDKDWDWLIIDHYAIDVRFEAELRNEINNIMIIDDIADRVHDCDILLDQNLYSDMEVRYAGKVPETCQTLLGPKYALLRDEFRLLRSTVKPGCEVIKRIFVFFGGVDPENLTGRTLDAINKIEKKEISVDVVIGSEHPCRSKIIEICKSRNYSCHVQTTRMAEIMVTSDLAIGASGSASWERCCLGLATISLSFAENQVEIARELERVGACIFLGDHESVTEENIKNTLLSLISDNKKMASLSENAFSIVDGYGTNRVFSAVNNL